MSGRVRLGAWALVMTVAVGIAARAETGPGTGVIRLGPAEDDDGSGPPPAVSPLPSSPDGRRSFDYEGFEARFQGYWFQRRARLRERHDDEAARQSENIRSLVAEEGIRRLEAPAGALVSEAAQFLSQGHHGRALASLALAESLDPGRPQIRFLRARVLRDSGAGIVVATTELAAGVMASLRRIAADPAYLHPLPLAGVIALLSTVLLFALLMVLRYNVPFRHEIEEWATRSGLHSWAGALAWGGLFLPLLLWITAGWIAIYWIVVTFRFMRRTERVVAIVLLLANACAVPGYRLAVGTLGMSADPRSRTMLAAASGAYAPDLVVEIRRLIEEEPENPDYHFLLAGLYKHGRYFNAAYEEYKRVLDIAPDTYEADINIGNIFFLMGQYSEAVAQYRRAVEKKPDSVLAYCNMHLAQTESFQFSEATATFEKARAIDADRLARLLSDASGSRGRSSVVDASIDIGAVWKAAAGGRRIKDWLAIDRSLPRWSTLASQLVNPFSLLSVLAVAGCGVLGAGTRSRPPARQCTRCGRPFCSMCRSSKEKYEYCTQCLHLFVLQDGLAPETKTRKMYEIESHQRRRRMISRIGSLLLPGFGSIARGRPALGVPLMATWVLGLAACVPALVWPIERFLGLDARLDLLRARSVPPFAYVDPLLLLLIPLLLGVWTLGNAFGRRAREA